MSEEVIEELSRTIRTLCKRMRKEKEIDPQKLSALARLTNALSNQESKILDPYEYGIPVTDE